MTLKTICHRITPCNATFRTSRNSFVRACILLCILLSFAMSAQAQRPEIWFSPTDDVTQHSRDFQQLFRNPQSWAYAASRVSVISLPANYLLRTPAPVVRSQLAWIASRNIKLSVQLAALPVDKHVCGDGVEGMIWPGEAAHNAKALKALGARVDFFAIDLPLTNGHIARRERACQLSIQETAVRLASAVQKLREEYPNAKIVDLEVPTGIPPSEWAAKLTAWLDAYHHATGENFWGVTMDAWWKFDWLSAARVTSRVLEQRGIRVGMYIDAVENSRVPAAEWVSTARRNACELQRSRIHIDYAVVANWMDMQVSNTPESNPATLTGLLAWYEQGPRC